MKFPEGASGADEHLCDMLDALEAGLTHLLRERDELREKLGCLSERPDAQNAGRTKPRKDARKSRRSRASKTRSEKSNSPHESSLKRPKSEGQPKASRNTRMALGRTLTQLRLSPDAGGAS
jgi:hypothetical protein